MQQIQTSNNSTYLSSVGGETIIKKNSVVIRIHVVITFNASASYKDKLYIGLI
jgi:hypothetical protein